MGAHTTSDDPTRYRLSEELETWKHRDPIERVRAYLIREAGVAQEFFDGIEAESEELAIRIRQACRALEDPSPLSVFDQVYVEITDELAEQRSDYADYLASFEGAGR
jgi:2-oxoisovalerate dehydrogenase E1 component alpha subunit